MRRYGHIANCNFISSQFLAWNQHIVIPGRSNFIVTWYFSEPTWSIHDSRVTQVPVRAIIHGMMYSDSSNRIELINNTFDFVGFSTSSPIPPETFVPSPSFQCASAIHALSSDASSQPPCQNVPSCASIDCGLNAICRFGACVCNEGWGGVNCSEECMCTILAQDYRNIANNFF